MHVLICVAIDLHGLIFFLLNLTKISCNGEIILNHSCTVSVQMNSTAKIKGLTCLSVSIRLKFLKDIYETLPPSYSTKTLSC